MISALIGAIAKRRPPSGSLSVVRSIGAAPSSTYARALLSGIDYGVDMSGIGVYQRLRFTLPPNSTYERALLDGTTFGVEQSGAGV
jgi:hypothetical protein